MSTFLKVSVMLIFSFPSLADPTFRVLQALEVSGGTAFLTVSERPHVLGQPFHVELRVNCSQNHLPIEQLEVRDSFSVCDMQPESIQVNTARSAVALKAKMADVNTYYDLLGSAEAPENVPCHSDTTIKKFSLRNLCSGTPFLFRSHGETARR